MTFSSRPAECDWTTWVTACLRRTVWGRLCCVVGGIGAVPPVKMHNLMGRKGHSHFLCGYSKAAEWILDQKMSLVNRHQGENKLCAIMGFTSNSFGLGGEMVDQLWQNCYAKEAALLLIIFTFTDNSFVIIFQKLSKLQFLFFCYWDFPWQFSLKPPGSQPPYVVQSLCLLNVFNSSFNHGGILPVWFQTLRTVDFMVILKLWN